MRKPLVRYNRRGTVRLCVRNCVDVEGLQMALAICGSIAPKRNQRAAKARSVQDVVHPRGMD